MGAGPKGYDAIVTPAPGEDFVLEGELTVLVTRAAEELRSDAVKARTITAKVRDHDFTTRQASRTVDEALESDRGIFLVARELMRKLRKTRRVPVRLIGVSLSNFSDPPIKQLGLFESAATPLETRKDRDVSRVMDKVREKFGRDAIGAGRKREPRIRGR